MRLQLLLLCGLLSAAISAQPDAYHANLVEFISTQYTLSGETYPFYDTEVETLSSAGSYNVSTSTGAATMADEFTRVTTITNPVARPNRWDAGWNVTNTSVVPQGDKLLWVIWLRALPNNDGESVGKVGIIAERNDTYVKDVDLLVDVTGEWQRFFISFENLSRTQPIGGMTMGFHLGAQQQVIQVAGMAILNYGPDIALDQLPTNLNNEQYGGFEADAEWRAPAAARIEELRKADVTFSVLDRDGNALADADVRVRMQEHDFKFGTAVKSCRFSFGNCSESTFRERLMDLDGEGHGFNALVYENDLKWPAWEDEWISSNSFLTQNIDELGEDYYLRGHTLLWPGWQNMPSDMQANQNNPEYLKQRVFDHVRLMLEDKNFDASVPEWDVLNEVSTNTDLAAALAGTPGYVTGREVYAEVFELARELAPDAKLYINDYVTMTLKNTPGSGLYDDFKSHVGEIVAAGAPIDGIGFQGHLSSSPNSIYDVLATLDDFHDAFGLDAKITEYDLQAGTSEELAADYTTDFLRAIFSHESMTGFMMWNFWDEDTWANPGANFFDRNWNATPVRDAFTDLVFNEWWTEEDLITDNAGNASVSGFKGRYLITVDCNGEMAEVEMSLLADGEVILDCGQLVSLTDQPLPAGSVTASPNPSSAAWTVSNTLSETLTGRLFDLAGRQVWNGQFTSGNTDLNLDLPAGLYTLRLSDGTRASSLKLVRR